MVGEMSPSKCMDIGETMDGCINLLKGKCTGGLTYGSMDQWREERKREKIY
jgi:hypothetical protein